MSQQQDNPKTRREMWLTIALAVARDGLPEPDLSCSSPDYAGTPFMYIYLLSHNDARRWAYWLDRDLTDELPYHERPDLGRSYVQTYIERDGWRLHISGHEPLVVPDPAAPLAKQVAAAILLPDAPELPAEVPA